MEYPISETFYSIIGEGQHTGQAAFFIRLAGCNLNCDFCDTNYEEKYQATPEELYAEAKNYQSRIVVVTGGEPTIHSLKPIVDTFKREFRIYLETNGSLLPDTYDFDWIATSPKSKVVFNCVLSSSQEVKFLCGFEGWREVLETLSPHCHGHLWLMPIADGLTLNQKNIDLAVDYCLRHPKVKFCCQIHKAINVK